jgi:hypothetical protein
MGAWGEKAFENDAALDWLAQLEAEGIEALRELLAVVADVEEDDYLDVDDGAPAVAAAEIVAAASGSHERLPTRVRKWLEANAPDFEQDDRILACRALERVVGPNSELRGLWEDVGHQSPWHADVRVLLTRLGSSARIGGSRFAPSSTDSAAANAAEKDTLLTFLRARGLEPTERQLARIHASRSVAEVRSWLGLALIAPSVEDVLDG